MSEPKRIVYMGTPEFAVPPLEALIREGFAVIACVTQPDRPSGRGNRMAVSPVKATAMVHGISVLQFERLSRAEGLEALSSLSPDLFVTAAFGQILSKKALAIPKLGTVNLHASLLPKYRGPAPVNWCIIEGETKTGVTTMMTDAGVDTGDILLSREVAIFPGETAGELTARLSDVGAALLIETLRRGQAGNCPRAPQDHEAASRHPILQKEHGRIDFSRPAKQIENLVRGVNPWPGAWTRLPDGGVLKIFKARAVPDEGELGDGTLGRALRSDPKRGFVIDREEGVPGTELRSDSTNGVFVACEEGMPGTVLRSDPKRGLVAACGEGALEILELQAPNAKRMTAGAYLLGHPIPIGLRFH